MLISGNMIAQVYLSILIFHECLNKQINLKISIIFNSIQ